jgi:hypothetical protein
MKFEAGLSTSIQKGGMHATSRESRFKSHLMLNRDLAFMWRFDLNASGQEARGKMGI